MTDNPISILLEARDRILRQGYTPGEYFSRRHATDILDEIILEYSRSKPGVEYIVREMKVLIPLDRHKPIVEMEGR